MAGRDRDSKGESSSECVFSLILELRMNSATLVSGKVWYSQPEESGNAFECLAHRPGLSQTSELLLFCACGIFKHPVSIQLLATTFF